MKAHSFVDTPTLTTHTDRISAARTFAERATKAARLADRYAEELDNTRDRLNKTTSSLGSDFSGGASPEKCERAIVRMVELEHLLNAAIDECVDAKRDYITTFAMVASPAQADILMRRFLNGQSFELIAVELGYSYRHAQRMVDEALGSLASVIDAMSMGEEA